MYTKVTEVLPWIYSKMEVSGPHRDEPGGGWGVFREGPPEPWAFGNVQVGVRCQAWDTTSMSVFLPSCPLEQRPEGYKRVNLGLAPAPILFSSPSENQRYTNWPLEGARRLPSMAGR